MTAYDLTIKLEQIQKEIQNYYSLLNLITNFYYNKNFAENEIPFTSINNYIDKKLAELESKKEYIINILSNIQIDNIDLTKI